MHREAEGCLLSLEKMDVTENCVCNYLVGREKNFLKVYVGTTKASNTFCRARWEQ